MRSSGMQRFLDAPGQRGTWMPRANEVLGCPGQGKSLHFLLSSRKSAFFRKKFRFLKKHFLIRLPKFLTTLLPKFFTKTGPLDAPCWMPWATAPSAPPPLHTTDEVIASTR